MSKSGKRATLITVLLTVILAAAVVVGCLFGVNKGATVADSKTLTVSVDNYNYNSQMQAVQDECEKVFGDSKVSYEIYGEMTGDVSEIVYVFCDDVDVAAIQKTLQANFDAAIANESSVFYGANINVDYAEEVETLAFAAKHYVLRAFIAALVFAVLAFIYVAIRYGWNNGVIAAVCTLFAITVSAAIVLLARIPVTSAAMYSVLVSGLFAAVAVILNINKAKADEEKLVATKEIVWLCGATAVAIALVGALTGVANIWFAVSAVVSLAVAAFISLVYAPALYPCMKAFAQEKTAANDKFSYKGAEKTSTKQKKAFVAPVKEVEEAPAEETEEPVEQAEETEEVVEETEEETVEEVEEPVEEAEEEKKED